MMTEMLAAALSRGATRSLVGAVALGLAFIGSGAAAQTTKPPNASPVAPPRAAAPAAVSAPAPVDIGKRVFRQCAACHSLVAGQNLIGPSLHGMFTRKAGSAAKFKYSTAMQKSGIVWNEAVFLEYITDPRKKVPGTTMAFAGVRKPEERAALYAYLKNATK